MRLEVEINRMNRPRAVRPHVSYQEPTDIREVLSQAEVNAILTALEDEYCRTILESMSGSFSTAQQVSERCDMPISTTYRKLNKLVEVGLVDTSIRLRRSGHHTKEFAKGFQALTVRMDGPEGMFIEIDTRSPG